MCPKRNSKNSKLSLGQIFRAISCVLLLLITAHFSSVNAQVELPHVAIIKMNMMILPGTAKYLKSSIAQASTKGAKILIVELNTPGGVLDTSQEMVQELFQSPIPIVIYVSPQGAIAGSAGVFITMAGHIAAMAPGTSIGAAHPVQGDGKNIEGDMRQKAENLTIAMVKSIATQRGRNVEWAERSVKESSSLTAQEALNEKVIDLLAQDIPQLLSQLKGRKAKIASNEIELGDYSNLPLVSYEMRYQEKFLNVLANPNVAALLWLVATTGISIELYSPGAVLPGVVGVIALILALIVSQIIPISQGALALLIVGAVLIGIEFFTGSIVLGIGGIVAVVIGSIYLVDSTQAPGLAVSWEFIAPIAAGFGAMLLFVAKSVFDVMHGKNSRFYASTGDTGMLMQQGKAVDLINTKSGRVQISGEYWKAICTKSQIEVGDKIQVVKVLPGLMLEVEQIP